MRSAPSLARQRRIESLYSAMNAGRFSGALPPPGRGLAVELSAWRVSEGRGILMGEWEPKPNQRARPGCGTIRLYYDAGPEVLLHEMIHQALDATGLRNGHGVYFRRVAASVGYDLDASDWAAARRELGSGPSTSCWCRG